MLKHFKKGFLGDYWVKVTLGKLCTLSELEWPTFGFNWPPQGTLEFPTIRATYQVIVGNRGFQDKIPYINSWLQVSQTIPPWV
jgi:hypothetical protein